LQNINLGQTHPKAPTKIDFKDDLLMTSIYSGTCQLGRQGIGENGTYMEKPRRTFSRWRLMRASIDQGVRRGQSRERRCGEVAHSDDYVTATLSILTSMPRKSIFRQPDAKHFQLVHRSQRDPLIHDPDASKHVLKPFERENTKKVASRNIHKLHF
jgi:hypothetical protein